MFRPLFLPGPAGKKKKIVRSGHHVDLNRKKIESQKRLLAFHIL